MPYLSLIVRSLLTSSRRGFSTYELLIAVSLVSLLTTMSATYVSSWLGQRHLSNAVSMISDSTVQARQLAMSTGDPVALVFSKPADGPISILILKGNRDANGSMKWSSGDREWSEFDEAVHVRTVEDKGQASLHSAGNFDSPFLGELSLPLRGAFVSDFDFVLFRPNGTIDTPSSRPRLKLSHVDSAHENDDCLILFQEASGRAKIVWN